MSYDISNIMDMALVFNREMEPEKLFETVLKQAMEITNCDGGTIYSLRDDCLVFEHLYTKSKYVELSRNTGANALPPVPLDKSYACAFAAITKKVLNIRDVYYAKEYNFEGTYTWDKANTYRSHSMLIVPMISSDKLVGVLQLINSLNEEGSWVPFTEEHEMLCEILNVLASLKIENLKLKGVLK